MKVFLKHFPLAPLVLICLAIYLVARKSQPALNDYAYLQYGFDSTRMLGFANQFLHTGQLDYQSGFRYGLIVFAAFLSWILNLLPSQTMIIPFITINIASPLFIFLFASSLTRPRTAALAAVIFSLFSPLGYVSASYFAAWVIIPLRLYFLVKLTLTQSTPTRHLTLLGLFFFSLTTTFTYPIYSLPLDFIQLLFILIILRPYAIPSKILSFSLIIPPLSLLLHFLFSHYLNPQFSYPTYIIRSFNLIDSQLPSGPMVFFISMFYLAHLGLALRILDPLPMIRIYLPRFRLPSLNLTSLLTLLQTIYIISVLVLPVKTLLLLSQPGSYIFPIDLTHSNLYTIITHTLFRLAFIAPFSFAYWTKTSRSLKFITLLCLSYLALSLYPFSSFHLFSLLGNKRFITLFLPFCALLLARFITTAPKILSIPILTRLIPFTIYTSTRIISSRYLPAGQTPTIQAMDWFSHQSNFTDSIFFSSYFAAPQIPNYEKPYALHLIGSIHPIADLKKLAKCHPIHYDCVDYFTQYLDSHPVKYLVIEGVFHASQRPRLYTLGDIIYHHSITIIKLH